MAVFKHSIQHSAISSQQNQPQHQQPHNLNRISSAFSASSAVKPREVL
jgi:hypothetical protein